MEENLNENHENAEDNIDINLTGAAADENRKSDNNVIGTNISEINAPEKNESKTNAPEKNESKKNESEKNESEKNASDKYGTEPDFIKSMEQNLNIKSMDPLNYSSLALAYIGDDAYDLIIRTLILSHGNSNVNKMNKKASSLVKAETQSKMVKIIEPFLTEEEMGVYKRGRNAKSVTTAKNASVNDYRRATGFEALIGYLYLKKRFDRMTGLVKISLEGLDEI